MELIRSSFLASRLAKVFSSSCFKFIRWGGTSPEIEIKLLVSLTDCIPRQVLKLKLDYLDLFLNQVDDFAKFLWIYVLKIHAFKCIFFHLVVFTWTRSGARGTKKYQLPSGFSHFLIFNKFT